MSPTLQAVRLLPWRKFILAKNLPAANQPTGDRLEWDDFVVKLTPDPDSRL